MKQDLTGELIERWHQRLARDPLPAERYLEQVVAAGARFGDRPLCTHRRPHIITGSLLGELSRSLALLHQVVRRVREALVSDGLDGREGSLARRFGVSREALRLAAIDPGFDSTTILGRVDCFVADGRPWFLELNAESPTGMAYADVLTDLFRADPIMGTCPELLPLPSADALVRELLATWRSWSGSSERPRVAIVDFDGQSTAPEFELFRRRFHLQQMPCTIEDPRALSLREGRLYGAAGPIDLVYRRALVEDLLARPEDSEALVKAYSAGAVCVVNSLRTTLLHTKGIFALMHDDDFQRRLTPPQRKMVREHVPWTALWTRHAPNSRESLFAQAIAEQRELVLKPLDGHGGRGVVLGWGCGPGTWERALQDADNHVLQRRVPELRLPFPDAREGYAIRQRLVDLDPFLIRGRLSGLLCRLSDTHLSNVHSGASQVPVFVTH